jgi:hypothetical protein
LDDDHSHVFTAVSDDHSLHSAAAISEDAEPISQIEEPLEYLPYKPAHTTDIDNAEEIVRPSSSTQSQKQPETEEYLPSIATPEVDTTTPESPYLPPTVTKEFTSPLKLALPIQEPVFEEPSKETRTPSPSSSLDQAQEQHSPGGVPLTQEIEEEETTLTFTPPQLPLRSSSKHSLSKPSTPAGDISAFRAALEPSSPTLSQLTLVGKFTNPIGPSHLS